MKNISISFEGTAKVSTTGAECRRKRSGTPTKLREVVARRKARLQPKSDDFPAAHGKSFECLRNYLVVNNMQMASNSPPGRRRRNKSSAFPTHSYNSTMTQPDPISNPKSAIARPRETQGKKVVLSRFALRAGESKLSAMSPVPNSRSESSGGKLNCIVGTKEARQDVMLNTYLFPCKEDERDLWPQQQQELDRGNCVVRKIAMLNRFKDLKNFRHHQQVQRLGIRPVCPADRAKNPSAE